MATVLDALTVGCFLVVAGAYFWFALSSLRVLLQLLVAVATFAVANQLGNAGFVVLACILLTAGLAYAAIVIRQTLRH